MNVLRLRATNYGPYPDLDVAFEDGCTAILGEIVNAPEGVSSNGSGKSHILQGIALALFGPGDGVRSLAPYLTRDGDETELMVELTFEHAGETYRVRRGYSARGAGKTTLDLEQLVGGLTEIVDGAGETIEEHGGWVPLTRASTKETQQELERIVGLSRDTFLASSLALQGAGSFADPSVNPAARKRLLADALGLARWDRFHDQAKQDRKDRQQQLDRIEPLTTAALEIVAGKADIQAAIVVASSQITADEKLLADAQARLDAALERHRQADVALGAVTTARARVETAEAEARRLRTVTDTAAAARDLLGPLEQRQRDLHPQVEELPALEGEETRMRALVEAHRRRVSEHEALVNMARSATFNRNGLLGRASELNEKAQEARDQSNHVLEHFGTEECDRCGQTLGLDAARRAAESFRADAARWDEEAETLDEQARAIEIPEVGEPPAGEPPTAALEALSARVHAGRQARIELAQLAERVRNERQKITHAEDAAYLLEVDRVKNGLAQARADLDQAQAAAPTPAVIARIKTDGLTARADLNETQARLDRGRAELARDEERLNRVHAAEEQLSEAAETVSRLHDEIDVLAQLERAYSRDGIPALVLENAAIPFIETEASRILSIFGVGFRVELRTQAALKTSDGLRDTLDVIIVGETGSEQPYALCSGGEKQRIRIALHVALAELMAHRRGAASDIFAIDEPDGLDRAGRERLVEILRDLDGTFAKRCLISHHDDLRDAFDSVILVRKDGSRSSVVSADREPVAA